MHIFQNNRQALSSLCRFVMDYNPHSNSLIDAPVQILASTPDLYRKPSFFHFAYYSSYALLNQQSGYNKSI